MEVRCTRPGRAPVKKNKASSVASRASKIWARGKQAYGSGLCCSMPAGPLPTSSWIDVFIHRCAPGPGVSVGTHANVESVEGAASGLRTSDPGWGAGRVRACHCAAGRRTLSRLHSLMSGEALHLLHELLSLLQQFSSDRGASPAPCPEGRVMAQLLRQLCAHSSILGQQPGSQSFV